MYVPKFLYIFTPTFFINPRQASWQNLVHAIEEWIDEVHINMMKSNCQFGQISRSDSPLQI